MGTWKSHGHMEIPWADEFPLPDGCPVLALVTAKGATCSQVASEGLMAEGSFTSRGFPLPGHGNPMGTWKTHGQVSFPFLRAALSQQESEDAVKALAKEKDLLEREKWELRRQAKEATDHASALRSQLDLKDNRMKELEAELAMVSLRTWWATTPGSAPRR